jgi:general nucleoside transport system permease protein
MIELLSEGMIISILAATIRIASPLILAALGELICERGGVVNLSIEGMMYMGAFVGFFITWKTESPIAGILAGAVSGMLVSLIMAFMVVTLKLKQFVTGLAINLLAAGLVVFWYRLFGLSSGKDVISIKILQTIKIPFLSEIPYLGKIVFEQNIVTYFTYLMVLVVWYFLYRTKFGLELRCLGENPASIDMKGLSVEIRQYCAVLFGGLMAGMAGAFLSAGSSFRFVPGMTAGRGWLVIVIVIAGNWKPKLIMMAAMLFALLDAFQLHVQAIGINFPYQILLALPYVVAILAVMFSRSKSNAPAHAGIPYIRESS